MIHFSTSGVSSPRRLPAVIQRKLARCKGSSGRICLESQRSSLGSQDEIRPSFMAIAWTASSPSRDYGNAIAFVNNLRHLFAFPSIRCFYADNDGYLRGLPNGVLFGKTT